MNTKPSPHHRQLVNRRDFEAQSAWWFHRHAGRAAGLRLAEDRGRLGSACFLSELTDTPVECHSPIYTSLSTQVLLGRLLVKAMLLSHRLLYRFTEGA